MKLTDFFAWNRQAAGWLEQVFPNIFSASSYVDELATKIVADIRQRNPGAILEAGGIDRPLLIRSEAYQYIGLDIEDSPACHEVYDRFLVQSIEDTIPLDVDMVISITLLEHVRDNDAAVGSMFRALRAGGTTHHYVPSKWHPYSVCLRLVGPRVQKRWIPILRPAAVGVSGYPAYFDHCSPSAMATLFHRHGFRDIHVRTFFGGSDYFAFFLPAYVVIGVFERACAKLKWNIFASGFVISARKPDDTLQRA